MICDTLEHLGRYRGLHKNLDTALDFLARQDLAALPMGKTVVDGADVFVMRMESPLHPAEGAYPEYHRLYADLQLDLTGAEAWAYASAPGAEVGEYRDEMDIGFQNSPAALHGILGEGRFMLFFPGELHQPGLCSPGSTQVDKIVVKIKMEEE